ncbi:hypothetical protein M3P05_07905 [Sansalvadorimonas sp. 2012CJ34-2]|uniref:Lipo-like protein n=1 Tax=Parendozoicomonas callyspongiae TaxID=2942213 RepID=A0ABT0PER0_9GAMM|nr:hypothetical protein [Sansalvadorimonas sp. 2012CJ34-2]MCL6269864.1 hypothetical protein [Sansalvadorimonas sp. 2012CJ34-2]
MIQGRISQIFPSLRHNLLFRCTSWLTYESEVSRHALSDFDEIRHELKPCDVVLVEGRSRVARIIQRLTFSRWSHAMLYIGRLEDIEDEELSALVRKHFDRDLSSSRNPQLIIESEFGIGTVTRPLSIYRGEHLRICRPQGLVQSDRYDVLKYAASRLGQEYDIRQIIDLCRLLLPTRLLPRRWRSTLFRNPEPWSRTTCATLIAEAFSFVNFPVRPLVVKDQDSQRLYQRNPKHCTPGDFDYSPWFQVNKFPSPQTGTQGFYKRLPWQKGKLQKDNLDHSHLDQLTIQSLKQLRQGKHLTEKQAAD